MALVVYRFILRSDYEISEGIEVVTFAGGDQAEMHCRRTAAAVATAEEPIFSAQTDASQRIFRGVVARPDRSRV
jgi:hypothetical protein